MDLDLWDCFGKKKIRLISEEIRYISGLTESHLTLQVPETKIAEFANSTDLDQVSLNEPPHLDVYCLPSTLLIFS